MYCRCPGLRSDDSVPTCHQISQRYAPCSCATCIMHNASCCCNLMLLIYSAHQPATRSCPASSQTACCIGTESSNTAEACINPEAASSNTDQHRPSVHRTWREACTDCCAQSMCTACPSGGSSPSTVPPEWPAAALPLRYSLLLPWSTLWHPQHTLALVMVVSRS